MLYDNLDPRTQIIHIKMYILIQNFCYTYLSIDNWRERGNTKRAMERADNYRNRELPKLGGDRDVFYMAVRDW
jgi:hypothetical protein